MISPDFDNIAIIIIKDVNYCCFIYGVGKSDSIHLLENSVFNDRGSS